MLSVKLERSLFSKNSLCLFLENLTFRERYFHLRGKPLTFRPLETDDQRIPPLDHGAVTSGFFYFVKLTNGTLEITGKRAKASTSKGVNSPFAK